MNSNFKLKQLDNNSFELLLLNIWNKDTLSEIIEELKKSKIPTEQKLIVDFKELKELDSCATIYLISFFKTFQHEVSIKNLLKYEEIYRFYEKHYQDNNHMVEKKSYFIECIGEKSYEIYLSTINFISFVGKVFYFFIYSLIHPKKIRWKAMFKYIDTSAVNALFIVGVTSILVGVVIAYQGAVQLEKFGANIFIVEMISITMLREIAPLLTAIVIAGRSASSYTAQIGAMRITEEIDAMRTMNFEPTLFLTIPRVLALVISLPLLVFFSDIMGILGGMFIAYIDLNITFYEFIHRLGQEIPLKHLIIGLVKALFFGMARQITGFWQPNSSTK